MRHVKLDNVVLGSASKLPFKDEWRSLANGLPAGSVLFIMPVDDVPIKLSMRKVAATLRRQGRRVAAVHAEGA